MGVRSCAVGLLGAGIGSSLARPLQEGEGRAQDIALTYRLVDSEVLGLGLADTRDVVRWAVRLGFDGLAVTHPFKTAVMACVDAATPDATALGSSNLVTIREGRTLAHNTDWVGFAGSFRAALPEAVGDPMVLLGAGGAGVAVGYAVLELGAAHLWIVDQDLGRADEVCQRLGALAGSDRVTATTDVAGALADAGGLIQATPVGMEGHPGMPVPAEVLRPELWVADIIYFPRETQLVRVARDRGCRVLPGGGMAVHQHAAAFELLTGQPADVDRIWRHFAELTAAGG